jgi:ribose transport system ATP-binding protein
MGSQAAGVALEARHISKRFGGTLALDDAGLALRRGEVHALLGENGSGKSTLIKVLAGYHEPEPGGELVLAGRVVELPLAAGEARSLGLRFVHQDLGLIGSLSVLENLRLEELAAARGGRISWKTERRRARETLARFGAELDPSATVDDLRPAERAMLAIVRAVDGMPAGGVLVLDEPLGLLPRTQREEISGLVRRIADSGSAVLLVSHDIAEVKALADRVTVLRDGRNAGTARNAEVDAAGLVKMVIGHELPSGGDGRRPRSGEPATVVLRALSGEVVRHLSLELRRGEVLGLSGLPGSGFEEVPYLLFGARACKSGWLELDERLDLTTMRPDRALAAGISLLPADRSRNGAVGSLSVASNVALPVLAHYAERLRLDRRRLRRDVGVLLAEHEVRPPIPGLPFDALSGGNQQKALLAKWLQTKPKLLLLDEPTRGVDVGARERIIVAIRQLAGHGMAVLCASGDHEQLALLCDRVLVLARGAVAAELAEADLTRETIAQRCHSLSG